MIEAYKHSNLANPSEQQDNYISAIDTDTTVTDDSSVLERIKSLTKRTVAGITLLALASCGVGNKTEATDQQSAPATVYVTVDNTPEVTSGVESTEETTTDIASEIGEPSKTLDINHDESNIPDVAAKFVDKYSGVYSHPLAVFYAESKYKDANPSGALISQNFIDSYISDTPPIFENGETTTLGFSPIHMDANIERTRDLSIKTFNDEIPNLNRLLQLLARNTSPEARRVIKDQFVRAVGLDDNGTEGNANAAHLADFLQENVIDAMGDNAANSNYNVTESQQYEWGVDSIDKTKSYDSDSLILDDDPNTGDPIGFENVWTVVIDATIFGSNGVRTKKSITIENMQFDTKFVNYTGIDMVGYGLINND